MPKGSKQVGIQHTCGNTTEEKNYKPVSRILSWAIIYLSSTLLLGSICLPSIAAGLHLQPGEQPLPIVYVAFQHARFTRE